MKQKFIYILTFSFLVLSFSHSFSQVKPTNVSKAVYFDVFGPLSELPSGEDYNVKLKNRNEGLNKRNYPNEANSLPKGDDPVWQKINGSNKLNKASVQNFPGLNSSYYPSDCNGAAGLDYFLQTVNTMYSVFDKSGNQVIPQTAFSTLFEGVTGAGNDGDPIVIYDDAADRWLVSEFSISGSPDYMLIAISATDDPLGMWYRWSFQMTGMPDYMKFGVWRDGYYMATNTYYGSDIYVFERDQMLIGGESPQMIQFNNPWRPGSGFHCIQPLDNDGDFAPESSPGLFITINDDAWSGNDELWIYECDADWSSPGNSTFNRTQQIPVSSFDSNFGSWSANIDQPGTTNKIDAIPMILMYRAQYRNFGTHQTIVCNHSVDVDATNHAGVRWYELQKTGSDWIVRQEGTYAPDEHSRFMGSIAMNSQNEIALGYSVSSSTEYPGIRYCGQSSEENTLASGIMDIAEEIILSGTTSQNGYHRWGDYSLMSVDPFDDMTFWYTAEYYNGSPKGTQITAIQFSDPDYPGNFSAEAVSTSEILLNWELNGTGDPVLLAWSNDGIFGTPEDGTSYQNGDQIPGGGTVLSSGLITSFFHEGLSANTKYYYKIWANNLGATEYSIGVYTSAYTSCSIISIFPWTEGFEFGGNMPNCITQEYVSGDNLDWIFLSGNNIYPEAAHSGSYYSLLKDTDIDDDKTLLILPVLNLNGYFNAVLSFWHTQMTLFSNQDELKVLYKSSFDDNWTELAHYTNLTEEWTPESIILPDLTSDYYIAFEGNAKFGRGICIDDILIDINVGVEVPDNNEINIYPNPSGGEFIISMNKAYDKFEIIINDITGKTVYKTVCNNSADYVINLKNESKGIYFINIMYDNKVVIKKIVLQ